MASYSVLLRRAAAKDLEALPVADRRRAADKLRGLAENPRPHGGEKLSGQERYRVRQGDYRIIYEIDDAATVVRVVRIAHRREAYR